MDAPWLVVANYLKGVSEFAGAMTNPKIEEMFALSGSAWIHSDETPWCAAFVGACLRLSGYKSTNSLGARSYLNYGTPLEEPRPGCIVVFWRGDPRDTSRGHVAFFDHVDDEHIYVLGGNQGNMVQVQQYPRARVLAFRQPVDVAPMARSRILRNFLDLTGGSEGESLTVAGVLTAPVVERPIASSGFAAEPAGFPADMDAVFRHPEFRKKLAELLIAAGQPESQSNAKASGPGMGLTPVNAALGPMIGRMLNGNKTTFGTVGLLLTTLMDRMSPVGAPTVETLQNNVTPFMQPVALVMLLWGLLGKYEKWVYEDGKKP
jgi:uncharacterized protein (TIGR02594 family)